MSNCPPVTPTHCYDCPLIFSPTAPTNVPPGQLWYNTGTYTVNNIPMKHMGFWNGIEWTDLIQTPVGVVANLPITGTGTVSNPLKLDCDDLKDSCNLLGKTDLLGGANIQVVQNNDGTVTIQGTTSNNVDLLITGTAPNKNLTLIANNQTVDLPIADLCAALADSGCVLTGSCVLPVFSAITPITAVAGSSYQGTLTITNATQVVITNAPSGWNVVNTTGNTYKVTGIMPSTTLAFTLVALNACTTGNASTATNNYTITVI